MLRQRPKLMYTECPLKYNSFIHTPLPKSGFQSGASGKELAYQYGRLNRRKFDPQVVEIPRRRAWQPTPAFLPGESHGQRSLVGYSPWGCKELTTLACMQLPNQSKCLIICSNPRKSLYFLKASYSVLIRFIPLIKYIKT